MNISDLQKLDDAVGFLVKQKFFGEILDRLGEEINRSKEPFVWSVIELSSIDRELPECIQSCWIFALKKNVPSGCHYHSNSIQHMVTIKGQGVSKVGGIFRKMVLFESTGGSLTNKWYVIGKDVPHEFFPQDEDVIVVSFHTCEANELEEVDCASGEKRLYEAD
jgi:hypothetical protein